MTHLQERKLRVAKRRYTKEFREFAVERLRGCENIVALAKELHVSRRQLYRWRDEMDPELPGMEALGQQARTSTLRKEVNHLIRRRGNGSAVFDSADRDRTSAALWIPAHFCGTAAARDSREPQASGADYARG
jgi:transposase-like protein